MNSNSEQKTDGILQLLPQGGGFLRDPKYSFQPSRGDVWVSLQTIREYGLVVGSLISGSFQQTDRGRQLVTIDTICGLDPVDFGKRTKFDKLTPINPEERFNLGITDKVSLRIIDLIAPIGKGTRGMIVAPPKSGKTTILENLANAIHIQEPDDRIIVMLIDERPEEVTHFRRSVTAEVLASSSDQSIESHIQLAEMTLAQVRCELECGRDVVILVDSITRMARAFNAHNPGTRRTLSGGLDANALEIPRRFFGLARNIEHGGSVTVIATAIVDTGSRMDDYIFEEFKGTGNSEIVLDRSLSDRRIFPAINVLSSGTRKDELLYTEAEMDWINKLRRGLAGMEPEKAMKTLLGLMEKGKTNSDLIGKITI